MPRRVLPGRESRAARRRDGATGPDATGGGPTRRALLLAAAATCLRADSADQVRSLIVSLATALSEGNAAEFMAAFDKAMPGYEALWINVTALVRDAAVQSAVDILSNEGDDHARAVEADWLLHMTHRTGAGEVVRRRERVKCKAEKRGKKWRIAAFDPPAFFKPPRF